ncbi:MAG: TIGR03067 domain-containing protein [Planctomycetia bacterium]|nr:TIGR03067 domain-containing protein [Planctomycetia bacterium]
MKSLLMCAVALIGVCAWTAPAARAGELDGTWMGQTLVTVQGDHADAYALKLQWTFAGDEFTLKSGDKTTTGKAKIDAAATPKTLDILASGGNGPRLDSTGIYKIDGDTLTACYTIREGRPKEFKGGDGKILLVLKRQGK